MAVQQRLPIASRFRGPAFRAVETVLKTDPVLAGLGVTWRSREGHDNDMAIPAIDECPLIALTPLPRDNVPAGVDGTKINLLIGVQLFVAGTCVDDILALWEAIEDALIITKPFDAIQDVQGFFCGALGQKGDPGTPGIIRVRPQAPAFSGVDIRRGDNDFLMQSAEGSLACILIRPA